MHCFTDWGGGYHTPLSPAPGLKSVMSALRKTLRVFPNTIYPIEKLICITAIYMQFWIQHA
jgi:hypothetical protein